MVVEVHLGAVAVAGCDAEDCYIGYVGEVDLWEGATSEAATNSIYTLEC